MSTEEPNAGDILADKLGIHKLSAHVWALHYLLTTLLLRLRQKGAIETADLELMLEATQLTLNKQLDRLAATNPNLAEMYGKMKSEAESMLQIIQRDLKSS